MIIERPHCDSRVECLVRGEIQEDVEFGGPPTKVVLLECKVCHNPLLGITESLQVGENEYEWDTPGRLWPEPETNLDWGIPEIARNSLIEAKVCFKAKAYSACAVMCGRAIEGVCQHHDPKIRNLQTGLQKLKNNGVIDERIYNWGEALRLSRNLGAHATTEKVTREDAHDLLDFALAICEYVFVLNEKFDRYQKRKLNQTNPWWRKMARNRNADIAGKQFANTTVEAVWNKGAKISSRDSKLWRRDMCAAEEIAN